MEKFTRIAMTALTRKMFEKRIFFSISDNAVQTPSDNSRALRWAYTLPSAVRILHHLPTFPYPPTIAH